VSVVVPVYNKAKYLEACLDSVLSQQGVSVEAICIDDASTDASGSILRRYKTLGETVTVLTNTTRRGVAYSRNRGIEQAQGVWIQFTDGDDVLPAGSLAALVAAARRENADVVRGSLNRLRGGSVEPWPTATIGAEHHGTLLDLPEVWIPWFHTCYVIARDLLLQRGVRYPDLIAGEDPVFLADVLTSARRICVVPTVAYLYRQDEPRAAPTRRTLEDYLRHAEMVRSVYAERCQPCWDKYHPFVQDDLRLLLSQTALSPDERAQFEALIARL